MARRVLCEWRVAVCQRAVREGAISVLTTLGRAGRSVFTVMPNSERFPCACLCADESDHSLFDARPRRCPAGRVAQSGPDLPTRRRLQLLEPCAAERADHPILCLLGHVT